MRSLRFLIFAFPIFLFESCGKTNYVSAKVMVDCTGTYLRVDGKDFFVCNPTLLDGSSDNDVVQVSYHASKTCDDGRIHCEMVRQSDGYVVVDKVR